eukprot:366229-Chlamydomonas_euryale.AAC.43
MRAASPGEPGCLQRGLTPTVHHSGCGPWRASSVTASARGHMQLSFSRWLSRGCAQPFSKRGSALTHAT